MRVCGIVQAAGVVRIEVGGLQVRWHVATPVVAVATSSVSFHGLYQVLELEVSTDNSSVTDADGARDRVAGAGRIPGHAARMAVIRSRNSSPCR